VSRSLPKIANYEFTTLKPSLGYVRFVDGFRMTIADIPGIIEGAHQNKGLGLEFLRHVERSKVLLFMVDLTAPDPLSQLSMLEHELAQHAGAKFTGKYASPKAGRGSSFSTRWIAWPTAPSVLIHCANRFGIKASSFRPRRGSISEKSSLRFGRLLRVSGPRKSKQQRVHLLRNQCELK
jgi:hypothetical protein